MRSYVEESSITIEIDNFIPNTNVTQPPILDTSYKVDSSLNYSGLKCLFSSSNGCYSSSVIEVPSEIPQTPRIDKNHLLELSYNIDVESHSDFCTNYNENSIMCIQDLNNPANKRDECVSSSREFDKARLQRLKNFNDLILNTSQSVNKEFDNEHSAENLDYKMFNSKSTSTPIEKKNVERGVQTISFKKSRSFPVNRRRSYRTSPMVLFYCKSPQVQQKQWRSLTGISFDSKKDVAIRNTTEMCTWIVSKIKQYHTQYFSQVLTKVIAWSGVIVNQGLAQLYQLCSKQNGNVQNDHKYKEIIDELNRIRHEVLEFREEFKNYREDNRRYVSTQMIPPPPPPPPISLPNIPLACKPDLKQQKKADVTKPIISLDDILKVKLKKVNDRTSMRRATEPIIVPSLRKNLKAVAPAKSLKDIESNSPCSALTRI
ncbi:hypothetical protein RN001_008635 [Aquatica leii]|uniref:Uncharacterized protein n=1 Tax=Aquatica leii TaxID=1421715 RepID=A0AAN7PXJ6_9COLE|nr:hypothetical protein RN001_008635 [Aquatica leii]